jgi:pSer/pThr/pTyr-binding forkhead associated (FHA) protein
MYLEILIDSQKPTIYLLNKPEIYIGSLTTNDIVISSTGISRKHVKIVVLDKKFYIIDQGSTNGTYMANERLSPGKRIEFTTAEPVRLGEKVYLNLSKEKNDKVIGQQNPDFPRMDTLNGHEKTQVISLKALDAAKNKKIEKKRKDILNKKAIENKRRKAQKETFIKTAKVLVVIVGSILIFKYSGIINSDEVNKAFFPKKEIAKEVIIEGIDEEADFKIPSQNLISKDDMVIHVARPKCVDPDEQYFCERIPLLTEEFSGVLKIEQNLIFFVNDTELIKTTTNRLATRVQEKKLLEEAIVTEFISKVNYLGFIVNSLSPLLDARHQTTKFYVVFMAIKDGKPELSSYFAAKGSMIPVIAAKYAEKDPSTIKDFSTFIHELDQYYQQY